MQYRPLGKTGISVSEIGFGTWGIGGQTEGATSYGPTDDQVSLASLREAFELGVNFYDTANIYGNGHSEELLGEAFGDMPDRVIIASKVGFTRHLGPHQIDGAYIRSSLEASLRRLCRSYVDLYQLHSVPPQLVRDIPEALETMAALKAEGLIRAFGYSVKDPADAVVAIRDFGAEVVQVNFNMVDTRAVRAGVLAVAAEHGAGVIARTPLCFGFLTGALKHTQFSSADHRSTWSPAQIEKWNSAPDVFSLLNPDGRYTPAQLALAYCLSFPEVSTVIPGMLSLAEVRENTKTPDLPHLSPAELSRVEEIVRQTPFFVA